MPLMQRARIPHPAPHKVHVENLSEASPLDGSGIQGQFCVQIAESSSAFHGMGVNKNPAAEPAANRSRSRRVKIMRDPFSYL